jgi:DASH complex subunit ASK1
VSLSGYEELANEDDTTAAEETTQITDTTTSEDYTPRDHDDAEDQSTYHDQSQHRDVEDSLLDDGSLTGSTPRPPATKSMKSQMQFAVLNSPYENLRRELKGDRDPTVKSDVFPDNDDDTTQLPGMTQQTRLPDMSMTPRSSSLLEAPTPTHERTGEKSKNKDPLLHRLLDKNYRIQATPHKTIPRLVSPNKAADKDGTRRALWQESPMSSPEMAAPKLRTNLYSANSPFKALRGPGRDGPRTPGVSVQTPATARKTKDVFANEGKGKGKRDPDEITWESDEDEDTGGVFGGMSPPKTIQFALPPSKLMQTPGRSALSAH